MHEEIFSALEAGAALITNNRRLARAFSGDYHAAQRARGRTVWRRPDILPLDAFLDRAWHKWVWHGAGDAPVALLDSWQEHLVWEQIIRTSPTGDSLLQIGETAGAAAGAWRLIHAYRLPVDGRFDATGDWAAFAGWSKRFEERCRSHGWIERAQLPDFLARGFQRGELAKPGAVYTAGFDEPTPQQSHFFRVLGDCIPIAPPRFESIPALWRFHDAGDEIRAASIWARRILEQTPSASIGIVVPKLDQLRARVERTFRHTLDPGGALGDRPQAFHVSLGPALAEYPLVHAALLFLGFGLRGLDSPSCGVFLRSFFLGGAEAEWSNRGLVDARLRKRGIWSLNVSVLRRDSSDCPTLQRILNRFEKLIAKLPSTQRASEWALDFSKLLEALGWPGDRTLSSPEYQVVEAWREALSSFAALDLISPPLTLDQAFQQLRDITFRTTFQIEDQGAPIQITGMLEAAGLESDHLWIMGLDDQTLPAPARPHPFIPTSLQVEHNLPHASSKREREFAADQLRLLMSASNDVVLSYPASESDRTLSPSPVIAGDWQTGPSDAGPIDEWIAQIRAQARLGELVEDLAPPVDATRQQPGGASLFKDMAACPFRAFAKHRLGAKPLDEASLGLSYKDRGNTVHKALEETWGELGSHQRLAELSPSDLHDLISQSAITAVNRLPPAGIGRALEQRRLEKILWDWMLIERSRDPFVVRKPEEERVVSVGGLAVRTRVDRVDELANGREIILDYKTGQVGVKGWDTDRPDEPQLPLYCAAGERPIAGAAFALIRVGELGFRGLAETGVSLPGLKPMRMGHEIPFQDQIAEWRRVLEGLAGNFRAGHAEVDPKPGACDNCGLWALCRIREFPQ